MKVQGLKKVVIYFCVLIVGSTVGYELLRSTNQLVEVGLVTDVGGIVANSYSEQTWAGLNQYQAIQPLKITYTEITDHNQRLEKLNSQAKASDIVIAPGSEFAEAIVTSAKAHPHKKYILLDAQPTEQLPNIIAAEFKEEEAGYLAGIVAALNTKTKAVAFIGGSLVESVKNFATGYVQGVHAVDPTITVEIEFAKSFQDNEYGYQLAKSLYQQNYDIIFAAAGLVGQGVITAAKEITKLNEPVWVIGVDYDQFEEGLYQPGKSVVLTSAIKRIDRVIAEVLSRTLEGTGAFGSTEVFDMTTGSVGLPEINPNLSIEVQMAIADVSQKISTQKIEIQIANE